MPRSIGFASENDYIQSHIYRKSLKFSKRKTGVIFYDCTNFFYEIEEEDDFRKYGVSKEHRPNPIVQMGLFMDHDGIPLAFTMNPGSTNEQLTLQPLEEKLLADFQLSKFIVCTDAGLSSQDNRKYNSIDSRAFITTQSIKKLKKHLQDWSLSADGWKLSGSSYLYNIQEINEENYKDSVFFKEERYDGFYGTCTNLDDDAAAIVKINQRRWEIEECFRIMKSEFNSRPVYLSREDRIKAHFMTCFISLIIYRFLEKELKEAYTCPEIIDTLRNMEMVKAEGQGWIPAYTRTELTDALHEAFGFRTDHEIVTPVNMKKICAGTKKARNNAQS